MHPHNLVALVTGLSLLLFVWMMIRVGRARATFEVKAPATTGHEIFERHHRVHINTLEQLAIYLPSLWIFALYWNQLLAAGLGLVWIIGRFLYMTGYVREPKQREIGFGLSALATVILLIGAIAGAVHALIVTGGV
jgi:glutathione S-transferase